MPRKILYLHGKGGMPAFGKMLKADELAEVITYTRNALGNKVGDEIQPKAIQELVVSNIRSRRLQQNPKQKQRRKKK